MKPCDARNCVSSHDCRIVLTPTQPISTFTTTIRKAPIMQTFYSAFTEPVQSLIFSLLLGGVYFIVFIVACFSPE